MIKPSEYFGDFPEEENYFESETILRKDNLDMILTIGIARGLDWGTLMFIKENSLLFQEKVEIKKDDEECKFSLEDY